jgi:hypothetical protein
MIKYLAAATLSTTLLLTACAPKEEPPQQSATPPQPEQPQKPAPAPETAAPPTTAPQAAAEKKALLPNVDASALTTSLSATPQSVMADLDLSMDDLKQKVAGLDVEQVTSRAGQYKELIVEYKDKLAGVSDKLKGLSMGDMLGGKGAAMKDEVKKYTEILAGLKDRYGVYLDKLSDYGIDLSAYGL